MVWTRHGVFFYVLVICFCVDDMVCFLCIDVIFVCVDTTCFCLCGHDMVWQSEKHVYAFVFFSLACFGGEAFSLWQLGRPHTTMDKTCIRVWLWCGGGVVVVWVWSGWVHAWL